MFSDGLNRQIRLSISRVLDNPVIRGYRAVTRAQIAEFGLYTHPIPAHLELYHEAV